MVEGEEQEKEQREEKDQQQREEMKLLCICRAVSGDCNGIIPNLHV